MFYKNKFSAIVNRKGNVTMDFNPFLSSATVDLGPLVLESYSAEVNLVVIKSDAAVGLGFDDDIFGWVTILCQVPNLIRYIRGETIKETHGNPDDQSGRYIWCELA